MASSLPSLLGLRVLTVHPRLLLTEVQLVDTTLLYRRLDGRDHVATEARAVRPSAADWAELRNVLDESRLWSWPRRWQPAPDDYKGEFAVGVLWDGRAVMSAGPIGELPEVDGVVGAIQRLDNVSMRQRPRARIAHLPRSFVYRSFWVRPADCDRMARQQGQRSASRAVAPDARASVRSMDSLSAAHRARIVRQPLLTTDHVAAPKEDAPRPFWIHSIGR